jgi:hypothetical protein
MNFSAKNHFKILTPRLDLNSILTRSQSAANANNLCDSIKSSSQSKRINNNKYKSTVSTVDSNIITTSESSDNILNIYSQEKSISILVI